MLSLIQSLSVSPSGPHYPLNVQLFQRHEDTWHPHKPVNNEHGSLCEKNGPIIKLFFLFLNPISAPNKGFPLRKTRLQSSQGYRPMCNALTVCMHHCGVSFHTYHTSVHVAICGKCTIVL